MDEESKLLENILRFIRLLRNSGIKIGNQSSIDTLNSIKILKIGNRNEFYWALYSNLIYRNEDTEIFDQCFHLFWQNPKILQQMFNLLLPQIGTQKAPTTNKKQLKRISDNIQKQNQDINIEKKDEIIFDSQMSWSNKSTLNTKDFEMMSLEEIRQAEKEIKKFFIKSKTQISRRWKKNDQSTKISTKYTIKKSVKNNGIIHLAFKERIKKFRPFVILIDISGSMESYSRMMLFLSHILIQQCKDIEVFTFGTKLTRITNFLKNKDIDLSLDKVGKFVNDWAAGTKITSSIKDFNFNWSRRLLTQNQTLLLITDGLERDDSQNLDFEINRLSLFANNIIWLNPLLRYKKFEPKVNSIKTILRHVDKHLPIHNLNSIRNLVENIF
tara:strand:+ start:500 stop:1651 length:1152 start_codon:yes stop_codon:yes gene_type:complete